jgi:hypothetical protein
MRHFVKTTVLLGVLLLGIGSTVDAQVSIGIRIGPPPAPRVVHVAPAAPAPGFVWVNGYWYPVGGHYRWHEGYWTRAPYAGARWVAPRYEGEHYYNGYWEGEHGRVEHDHHWDKDSKRRDYDHEGHGRGGGN